MSKNLIEAALNGPQGGQAAYFFRGDQFVVYDWDADRATLGAKSITDEWNLPLSFQPLGFAPRIDAALSGHESNDDRYRSHSYFFHGAEYIRHDWTQPAPRPPEFSDALSAWGLPATFVSGVDASFSGKFSREGKAYFFKGSEYARVNWSDGKLDYVKPIGTMVGMPAEFASGVDAAVDGDGPYADYSYLFKGDKYVRFNWGRDGSEPHVDNGPHPVTGVWQGLAELLFAGEAKSKAFEWLWAATPQLDAYRLALSTGVPYPDADFIQTALQTHFRIDPALPDAVKLGSIDAILANLRLVEAALHRAPELFRSRNEDECKLDGRVIWKRNPDNTPALDAAGNNIPELDADGKPIPDAAAFTYFGSSINFTKLYPTRGEACRAAQIIHEAVHFVDNNNAPPNDIPEWYVTPGTAAVLGLNPQPDIDISKISVRYDLMPFDIARHNPSSYVSFVQHLRYRHDTRYGELRQYPLPGFW